MPRSRSRSLLSITRSATCWCLANVPACDEQLVDERRLAVVDVGDDGDVAQSGGAMVMGIRACGQGRETAANKAFDYSRDCLGATNILQNPQLRL